MKNNIINIKVGKENYPTNCYIVYDENNNAVLIDPGFESEKIISMLKDYDLNLQAVIITHCHADHIGALEEILNFKNVKCYIHENDLDGIFDDEKAHFISQNIKMINIPREDIISVKDKDILKFGNMQFEVIHTPGHTNGCICLYEKIDNVLFTGDTIFCDCYGRCDLKSSSIEDMKQSIDKLFDRFSDVTIYPGHDEIVNIDSVKRRIRLLLKIRGM